MKTCHYCNIDFINVFLGKDILINVHRLLSMLLKVLMKMDGISEVTAKRIRSVYSGINWTT
jgi:hypothetical protein